MHEYFYISLMKSIRKIVLTLLFFVCFFFSSWSQHNYKYSHDSRAEKIYLQLDSKVYTTDKTIWFKTIVINAVDHNPTILSGVLYVELIDPDENIIEKKLIKIENGIGDGFFQLNQSYPEGLYLIRAYTKWNKNFNTDFFFKESIHVFAPSANMKVDPISNITLVEKQHNKHWLTAYFDPLAIDSLHKKKLTLFITLDAKKDSLTIKKNEDDKYMIDYIIPDESQFVTLQIQTKNGFRHSKTIALNKDYLDLQFFPESGELVHGIQSKVGFKALDYNGKGKSVEGEIVNEQNEIIAVFKSNQMGMGSFTLTNVDSNATYYARLKSQSKERSPLMYPLPDVATIGNVLSVIKNEDEIHLIVHSNYLKNDWISLKASCRGYVYFDVNKRLEDGTLVFSLSANKLPEGIIAFTLMNSSGQQVAERLYFNERPESRIKIALSTDKDTYTQRELTRLNIEATNNDGEPVNANLSLLVLNKNQIGKMQSTRQNILSYFLLSSDLKGKIENPGSYFSKENTNQPNLDALLLTQGWRKYRYTKPIQKIIFQPEPELTISGSVLGAISQDKNKEVELTMMTFGNSPSFQTQLTDSLGKFNFNLNDEYGQHLNVLIQSAKKSGKKKNYTIILNKNKSPAINFDRMKTVDKVDSLVREFVEKNIERKNLEDAFRLYEEGDLLDEVVIVGYSLTPNRKKVMEKYGKPDIVIKGKDILEKEKKWSYGLFSVLMFNFPDKISIKRVAGEGGGGYLRATVHNSGETLVVVDGIPVKSYAYDLIPNIPPSEVSSFEIIEIAKNYSQLYRDTYPGSSSLPKPFGSVIAIYTHAGIGIYGVHKPIGIMKTSVPVFSSPREFYTPKYKNSNAIDWLKPDLRSLVYWKPKVMVDGLGKVSLTFYNADNIGEMQVVVEAISDTGEIGYQEIVYDVVKRE